MRAFVLISLASSMMCSCAPSVSERPTRQFVLADPQKYHSGTEQELALQLSENDCKAKALAAEEALRKSILSQESKNLGAVRRARDEGKEMYDSTYTSCMNKAGYLAR